MTNFSEEQKAIFCKEFDYSNLNPIELGKSFYVYGITKGTTGGVRLANLLLSDKDAFITETNAIYEGNILRVGEISIKMWKCANDESALPYTYGKTFYKA